MIYDNISPAIFLEKKNRFLATILIDEKEELAHIKNTLRGAELFIKGAKIYVQYHDDPKRKTKYSIITIEKGQGLVNIDSLVPNKLFTDYVKQGYFLPNVTLVKPETTYQNSRFDFYIEADNCRIFVEVKGSTLEENNIALFPGAPTTRGIKHIQELIYAQNEGYETYIVFVTLANNVTCLIPAYHIHPEFGEILAYALDQGVKILVLGTEVRPDQIIINKELPFRLT